VEEQVKFFKALADASRLRIAMTLIEAPSYVELLAQRLELAPSTVSFHLKKLEEVGLVTKEKDQYYIVYSLNKEILDQPISNWLKSNTTQVSEEDLREQTYRQKILDSFFKFDKLKSIPVQRKKRLVILERLVEAFVLDRTYTEKEVNLIIADFHDDFATLRRELINERLMSRESGVYKRSHRV
jgi:ArsR family transcriptional regulator